MAHDRFLEARLRSSSKLWKKLAQSAQSKVSCALFFLPSPSFLTTSSSSPHAAYDEPQREASLLLRLLDDRKDSSLLHQVRQLLYDVAKLKY